MAKIQFKRGTKQQYDGLATKDQDTLYFITDTSQTTGDLYLGTKLLTNNVSTAAFNNSTKVLTLTLEGGGTVTTTLTGLITGAEVDTKIAAAISTVYKVKGSATCAVINGLTSSTAEIGDVYNVTDTGTISSQTVVPGDNVVCVSFNETVPVWDKLGASIDVSGKMDKVTTATPGHIGNFNSFGQIVDSGFSLITSPSDTPEYDKIPTELVVDSMISASETSAEGKFVRYDAAQTLTTTQQGTARTNINALSKLASSTSGNIIVASATAGEIADSGKVIGGATLSQNPDANTLATEAAVNTALSSASVEWKDIVE